MYVKVILVDVNPAMVAAWRTTFEENPEVEIVSGSMLTQTTDAWVSPTNSRGSMDGGLDGVIKGYLGNGIEKSLQSEIKKLYKGLLPVGHATCVPTGKTNPTFLISTPTMTTSSEDISDSLNVALACAAAFQVVHMQNAKQPGSIRSIAIPGLGANTGQVPVEICADLMWTGYDLFRRREFPSFAEMRTALEQRLGGLDPMTGATEATPEPAPAPKQAKESAPKAKAPPPTKQDVDFDDAE